MDAKQRTALITQYEAGYDAIVQALDGITDAEWDAQEAAGEWSPRAVVHHLADSEMTSAIRLRRLLVEDNPLIQGYDEAEFARRLHYDRPVEASLRAFEGARRSTAALFPFLTDADWQRTGTHSDTGPYTAADWLAIYAEHAFIHADQIRRARAVVNERR